MIQMKTKFTNQFTETNFTVGEAKKKAEFLDQIIQSMKKRMTEIQKKVADNAAQVVSVSKMSNKYDEEQNEELKENMNKLTSDLQDLRQGLEMFKQKADIGFKQIGGKAD